MSLRTAWETAAGLVLAQFEGPRYAFDLPSFKRVTVDYAVLTAPTQDHPRGTVIVKGSADHPRYKKWTDRWQLTVDRATGYADDAHWWVLIPKHGDGDKWGFVAAFLGLPGIILCLPALVPWWCVRKLLFKATGLDVHQLVLWRKLREQLGSEVRPIVLEALRKQNTPGWWTYQADKERREKARKVAEKAQPPSGEGDA